MNNINMAPDEANRDRTTDEWRELAADARERGDANSARLYDNEAGRQEAVALRKDAVGSVAITVIDGVELPIKVDHARGTDSLTTTQLPIEYSDTQPAGQFGLPHIDELTIAQADLADAHAQGGLSKPDLGLLSPEEVREDLMRHGEINIDDL